MKYLRLMLIFSITLLPVAALGLEFDPPLNEGIEFPETNVEETSIVELTISNNGNGNGLVLFDAPQNRVFSIEPLQVQIGGSQQAIMEFSFSPEEAGEVSVSRPSPFSCCDACADWMSELYTTGGQQP